MNAEKIRALKARNKRRYNHVAEFIYHLCNEHEEELEFEKFNAGPVVTAHMKEWGRRLNTMQQADSFFNFILKGGEKK